MPALTLIWAWLMPSIMYSTGSSTVMMFSTEFIMFRAVYRVVVFPLPVGPVTRDHAVELLRKLTNLSSLCLETKLVQGRIFIFSLYRTRVHTFPQNCGYGGDPQVQLPPLQLLREPAVLGNPSLGNVHIGHDLDPGNKGCSILRGRVMTSPRFRQPGNVPGCRV